MEEDQQISKMLYFMGGKANDILNTFKLSGEEKKSLTHVQQKFNNHYVTRKTKLYIRARFNTRVQREGESADEFITDLQTMAKKCLFNTMTDELTIDRLIVGMADKTLSLQLQNQEIEPTLEEVIDKVKHAEVANQQSP
ncbi:hypothetical protein FOCC_FOCC011973 [Frankliniella occidentalis]|nr:hypothetical protein FOCC_FOCC011973 [Frankliniella occidentalis]